jgi:hypothetical protein
MAVTLGATEIRHYRERGFVSRIPALSPGAAAALRARLERFEASHGGPIKGDLRHKTHLLFTWLDALVREARILDAVEDLLGPDLLVWNTNFFVKEARDPAFVSFHQDATYWGLSSPDVVTAWVAFTPSTRESGCMQVLPASHLADVLPHVDRPHAHNLLTRGQEVAVDVDPAALVDLELAPGEMSLHHVRLVHGSGPNRSDDRRIGFAIRYIPTHVRQLGGRDTASLVRGVDRFGHFDLEPRPASDFDAASRAAHAAILKRHTELLMKGSALSALR